MKKNSNPSEASNPWDDAAAQADAQITQDTPLSKPLLKAPAQAADVVSLQDPGYDMEGLMSDFPTATELQKFVFDTTGTALNLKGRANKLKYQVAMDCLNGLHVPPEFLSKENPYLDKNDLVPEEPLKPIPPRAERLPSPDRVVNYFHTGMVPHPTAELRAQGVNLATVFRKYDNGVITYEVLGPIQPRPWGEKIDKFGRTRPELIKWDDPRTGEQVVKNTDGNYTRIGQRLRAIMMTAKFGNGNFWDKYVDRDFASVDQHVLDNPWDLVGDDASAT